MRCVSEHDSACTHACMAHDTGRPYPRCEGEELGLLADKTAPSHRQSAAPANLAARASSAVLAHAALLPERSFASRPLLRCFRLELRRWSPPDRRRLRAPSGYLLHEALSITVRASQSLFSSTGTCSERISVDVLINKTANDYLQLLSRLQLSPSRRFRAHLHRRVRMQAGIGSGRQRMQKQGVQTDSGGRQCVQRAQADDSGRMHRDIAQIDGVGR